MWNCPTCGRIFKKKAQPHSCRKVPLVRHFKNKEKAKELFDRLTAEIKNKIGKCRIISIPCCVHLFGTYDFLAALPKKDKLEIRFVLNRKLDTARIKQCVPMSARVFKNCLDIADTNEIDGELLGWLKEAYHFKDGRTG